MAFPDPVAVTIGVAPFALNRLPSGSTEGVFRDVDQKITLGITPGVTAGNRRRNAARMEVTKITTDPLVSTTNVVVKGAVTIAFNVPQNGFTSTEIVDQVKALYASLTANTNALLLKLINGES